MKRLSARPLMVWLTFFLITLAVGSTLALNRLNNRDRVVTEKAQWMGTLARVIDKTISNQLVLASHVLDSLRDGVYVHSQDINQLASTLPGIRTILQTDVSGRVIASSRPELMDTSLAESAVFRELREATGRLGFSLSEPAESLGGTPIIFGVKKVTDSQGNFAGIVAVAFDPEYYRNLLDSVRDDPQMWVRLYHGADLLYLELNDGQAPSQESRVALSTDYAQYRLHSLTAWTVSEPSPPASGLPRVAAFRTINPTGLALDHPLIIEVGEDLRPTLAQLQRGEVMVWLLFVLGVAVAAVLLVLYNWRQRKHRNENRRFTALLQESSLRFQLATEAARLGVWEWNPATDVLTWDSQMQRLYGADPKGPPPEMASWMAMIVEEDRALAQRQLQICVNTREPSHRTFRIHRGGEVRWIQCNARFYRQQGESPARVIGINEDITARVESANNLVASERFLKTITEKIPTMIAYFDADEVCRFANDGYAFSHARRPEELLGKTISEILGENLYGQRKALIEQAKAGLPSELQATSENAHGVSAQLWIHYIPDLSGSTIQGFFVLVDDVSELRSAQAQLEAQQGRLILNSRMAQMGQLLSLIAHQWRQPLTVISTLVGNIQLKAQLASLDSEYLMPKLAKIGQTVVNLSDTIDTLRLFYAPAKQKDKADLGDLTSKALELLAPVLKTETLEVRFDPPQPPLWSTVFRAELMQVIIELIGNARSALSGRSGWVSIVWSVQGSDTVLEMSNNGGAIADNVLPKIFLPHYTSSAEGAGTGMGLHMVKVIIEDHHGGTIRASSDGDVTLFRISLPTEVPVS
ncbi:MAG: PAS domain-containing protein [Spirochaetales bacterium]